jgi:hypothetical protein
VNATDNLNSNSAIPGNPDGNMENNRCTPVRLPLSRAHKYPRMG